MLAQFRDVGHVSSKLSLTKQIPELLYLFIFIYTHANVTQTRVSSAFVWGTIFSCGLLPFLCHTAHPVWFTHVSVVVLRQQLRPVVRITRIYQPLHTQTVGC